MCQIDRCSLVTSGTLETGGWIAIKTCRALTEDLGGTHHAKKKREGRIGVRVCVQLLDSLQSGSLRLGRSPRNLGPEKTIQWYVN